MLNYDPDYLLRETVTLTLKNFALLNIFHMRPLKVRVIARLVLQDLEAISCLCI